jgi:hypothetical protein
VINARIKWFGRGSEGSGNRMIGSPYSRVRVEGRLRDICCQMPYAKKTIEPCISMESCSEFELSIVCILTFTDSSKSYYAVLTSA